MKLTRFTNHRPASNSKPRSSQSGQAGTIRKLSGAARITAATANPCSSSRGTTGMEWTSSAKPTAAMNSVAPKTATGIFISAAPANAMAVTAAISVAAITAMPPPCGVGIRWEERAFGLASAIRTSIGRIAHVRTPDNSAAGTAAANDSSSCELAILSAWKVAR